MKPSLCVLLAAGALVACARTRPAWPPRTDGHEIEVTVENDLVDRSDLVVRVLSPGGSTLLGGVPPGREQTFSYRTRVLSGSYRLSASTGDGRTVRSRSFTLFSGAVVLWQIQLNHLRVVRGSDRGASTRAPQRGPHPPV